jgi:hypothetical protein
MFRTLFNVSLIALSLAGTISTFTTPAFALLPAVQSQYGDPDDEWRFGR